MRDFIAHQVPHAVHLQHKRFQQRQRKETEMLISHRDAREAALSHGLIFRKGKQRYFHIGVGRYVIRRAMMQIVFVEPPAIAESEHEVRMNQPEYLISSWSAENLLMARVVNDKTKLREHECQESGVEQFDPGIVKRFDQQESGDQQRQVQKNFPNVIR